MNRKQLDEVALQIAKDIDPSLLRFDLEATFEFARRLLSVPYGYKLVPIVPTEEMVNEGVKWVTPEAVYEALLAATPKGETLCKSD